MEVFPNVPTKTYDQLHPTIKSGDILLCSGNTFFSNLIKQATSSIWSHVAFILRLDVIDRVMVLESVESIGVRAVPLKSYASNYNGTGQPYPGTVLIARHADLKQENIPNLSQFATDLLGYPYNTEEIVKITSRLAMGTLGFHNLNPDIPQREYICSEYAYACFKSIGVNIDYNQLGFIAPCDFARSKKVRAVNYLQFSCAQNIASSNAFIEDLQNQS